jgi:hypothetical protein
LGNAQFADEKEQNRHEDSRDPTLGGHFLIRNGKHGFLAYTFGNGLIYQKIIYGKDKFYLKKA